MSRPRGARRADTAAPAGAKVEKSIWSYLVTAVSAAVLLLVIALAAAVIVIPKVAGAIPLTVLTSSMKPGLPPGTLIIVRPIDTAELRVGDVATYQIESGKPGVITHRIISISHLSDGSREFVFQGDNNSAVDPDPVIDEQIQGRLWYSLPLLGWVNNAVNGESRAWILPVLAVALFAYAGYAIASGVAGAIRGRRRENRVIAAEDHTVHPAPPSDSARPSD